MPSLAQQDLLLHASFTFLVLVLGALALCAIVYGIVRLVGRMTKTQDALIPRLNQLPQLKPICSNCKHFDLEEGQALIAQHPAFMKAGSFLSPAQINRRVVRDFERECRMCHGSKLVDGRQCPACDGDGVVQDQELSPPSAPAKARWEEFGACLRNSEICWGGDPDRECFEQREPNYEKFPA